MRISIIGSRGIPARYGGFETFAEEISILLTRKGINVVVQCDKSENPISHYNGVSLYYSSATKSQNPFKYYYEGLRWGLRNSDIILVTGSGGAIFYFLKRPAGKVIITNTDGIESKRSKWSFAHRIFLKFSEMIAVWKSDYIIADSLSIKNYLINSYGKLEHKIRVIEYGSYINVTPDISVLGNFNLKSFSYYLIVCRIEPENNLSMIIDGYISSLSEFPLVIVGNLTNKRYVKGLITRYSSNNVRFLDGIYDKDELRSLRYFCKAYLHGHSIGGTNPSLLEAMGNKNLIICHDNQFNREVTADAQSYFSNSEQCAEIIRKTDVMNEHEIEVFRQSSINRIISYYNWDNILNKYLQLFYSISQTK
jgi:glycosyltransferase involved in cell wall biosynthesis